MKKILNFLLSTFLTLLFFVEFGWAQYSSEVGLIPPPRGIKGVWGKIDEGGPVKLIAAIVAFLVAIAVALFFIKIILSGIKIIVNGKDPAQFNEGMKTIMWGVIGIFIVASAYMIVGWVGVQLFGSPGALLNPLQQLPK